MHGRIQRSGQEFYLQSLSSDEPDLWLSPDKAVVLDSSLESATIWGRVEIEATSFC